MWNKGHEIKYWSRHGISKGSKIYENYYKIFDLDSYVFINKKIIDIGCGPFGGVFINRKDVDVTPVDFCAKEYNKMNLSERKIIFCDLNKTIPFENESFDYLICTNVLDHLKDIRKSLNELYRISKQGAIVFIHMHLRKKKNKAHIYVLDETQALSFILESKYKILSHKVDSDWVNYRKDRQAIYIVAVK